MKTDTHKQPEILVRERGEEGKRERRKGRS